MLSLSFASCYLAAALRKRSSEMAGRRSRNRRRRLQQLLVGCGLRFLVVAALSLFVVGILRTPAFPKSLLLRTRSKNHAPARATSRLEEARADITTQELYDKCKFDNAPGGAWTQGWDVQYKGDEWDQEKLKVLVVPHSHNDPGWLSTLEEYYQERTRKIISTIVQSLSKDHRRKFIWEEISFLSRWWDDAWQSEKDELVRLVKNGQLEIVGGGWVMNDEVDLRARFLRALTSLVQANSHYYAIIQQMTAGNLWLLDKVGVAPTNSWAVDPFGHSASMAYLLKRMGFKNMVIQRTHYQVKKALALDKSLEFLWRQAWDSRNTTDIFCHMMPFYFYDIPHTCGPEPAVCCEYDFWRVPGYSNVLPCPWGVSPQLITPHNLRERALKLLGQYRKKSTLYRSNTVLVPLGDDFRYTSTKEADVQFDNYQKLFDYINIHPELRAEVRFGTLEDYFSTLREEAARDRRESEDAVEVPGFPALSGDFFTYADRDADYWSGYYVTRPFYKAVGRALEATLRAADTLLFFSRVHCNYTSASKTERCRFMEDFPKAVESATRSLALFQHHDAITGTAKEHVVADYAARMHTALKGLEASVLASAELLLSMSFRHMQNMFELEQSRSKHDVLPVKKTIKVTDERMHRVTVFNSLATATRQVVTVMSDSPSVCVFDGKLRGLESQVTPEWAPGNATTMFSGRHRVQWEVQAPALGFQSYFLVLPSSYGSCKEAVLAKLKMSSGAEEQCPEPYECTAAEDTLQISNEQQTLGFDPETGLLKWMTIQSDPVPRQVEEDIMYYSSQGSGAYLFRPGGQASRLADKGGLVVSAQGPVMGEVHTLSESKLGGRPVTRSARIFRGAAAVELEYHMELFGGNFENTEIIARFRTDIDSRKVFYSDLNGYQMIRRQTYDKIPLQGNYYPMSSLAFVQDESGRRFSLHSMQAVGVASLASGWLEVMLDRRLAGNDDRGLGQGITDNKAANVVFQLLLEKNVSGIPASMSALPSLLSHEMAAQLNYPLIIVLGRPEEVQAVKREAPAGGLKPASSLFPLRVDFPSDLHLVSLKVLRPNIELLAPNAFDYGLTVARRGWDASYGKRGGSRTLDDSGLDWFGLFRDLVVQDIKLSNLNFIHDNGDVQFGYIEQVHRKHGPGWATKSDLADLEPMEIQAFKFSAVSNTWN